MGGHNALDGVSLGVSPVQGLWVAITIRVNPWIDSVDFPHNRRPIRVPVPVLEVIVAIQRIRSRRDIVVLRRVWACVHVHVGDRRHRVEHGHGVAREGVPVGDSIVGRDCAGDLVSHLRSLAEEGVSPDAEAAWSLGHLALIL